MYIFKDRVSITSHYLRQHKTKLTYGLAGKLPVVYVMLVAVVA